MSTLRRLRNCWIPWVTTFVLACCSAALAQTSYKVTDLGVLPNDNAGCAMALNNHGWTLEQDAVLAPPAHGITCKRPRGGKHRRTQDRPRHAWRTEQLDELGRDQRPRGSGRYSRNICSRSGRRRRLRLRHKAYVSSVSLAKWPHERSPDAGWK